MPYKRPLQSSKKFISPFYSPAPTYSMNTSSSSIHKEKDFLGIPLPNEKEVLSEFTGERKKIPSFSGILQFIQKHVQIEEIILVGLIILMLDESMADDLLLIILVYILLF